MSVKGRWISFCFLTMRPLDVILNCLPFGISLRIVRAFNSMSRSVCDLLDLRYMYTFLYFSVSRSLRFSRSIAFFSSNDENEILTRPGFPNLLLSREAAVTLILLSRLLTRSRATSSISSWVSVTFDAMMVRLGSSRGLFTF